jgi:hypothetical protein
MAGRAIIREADLRRWARISREEGVAIRGHVEPNGGVTITVNPTTIATRDDGDDLDNRLRAFAAR